MNKKNILIWLIFIVIMIVSWRISQNRSLSLRFVDEEDHIAFGYYINRGYRLHEQLQNNHQPLVYFASAAIQKIAEPENIFMLVRRHRQAMYFYGFLWSWLIIWRFRKTGLIFVLFFEFLKYYLFGNLLLLDSLAAYPAVYLFMTAISVWFNRLIPKKIELVWLGITTWLITFTLIPLWPWLGVVWLALAVKLRQKIIWPIVSFSILTAILFSYYSPLAWYHETIYNNLKYAIPALNEIRTTADRLRLLFFPFLAYFDLTSLQAKFIALFFSGWLIASLRHQRWLLLYPILVLANTRVIEPAAVYYAGFHLLPWMGLLIGVFAFSYNRLKFKPVFFLTGLALLLNPGMPYWFKTNLNEEYYINYSNSEDFNFAVRAIAKADDRLAVIDNKPLLYWQSGMKPATRQLVYYAWEPNVPELKTDYKRIFYSDNPPEIIYGDKEAQLLQEKYLNLTQDGQSTLLYIRKDRATAITPEQWKTLATRRFSR